MPTWLTNWEAIGAIAGIICALAALGAWLWPRSAEKAAKPDSSLTVSAIRIVEKNGKERLLPIYPGQSYTVGRASDNNIILKDDNSVSRHHAKFVVYNTYVEVIDQGAVNPMVFEDNPTVEHRYVKVPINKPFLLGEARFIVVA